ncbi:TrbI/VirB10 family protein [Burkholderia vietnamiensis]|uniref:TrbI/VirB10 family protein n=1 Tax=Burkholderia vietnamiensis TaxID=60552 RepID=UPI001594CADF|nr:TrbI/VirB10 family protein [Burkholderia vietnamiensis]MCA8270397.1 hypothetical protein [Burkholderia vietnamiensis]
MSNDNKIDPGLLGANPGTVGGQGGFTLRPRLSGVVTLNKNVKYALAGGAAVMGLVAAMTFNNVGSSAMNGAKKAVADQGKDGRPIQASKGAMWYEEKPNTNDIPVAASAPLAASAPAPASGVPNLTGQAVNPLQAATTPATSVGNGGTQQQVRQPTEQEMHAQQQLVQANDAPVDIDAFKAKGGPAMPTLPGYPSMPTNSTAPQLAGLGANAGREDDPNKQERKDQFIRDQRLSIENDYNSSVKTKPRSPYELKAGWLIPAAMISGLNSDLPGQVVAQVREPVYDSRGTGKLLIPPGARLIGVYDAHVAYGQQRILVVWNRVIFDDGSSYNIKGMPGADQAGYAGFFDKVDNHYVKTFASAAVIAVLGAGVQLSQPNNGNSNSNQPSVSQTLGASLGQQLGQTGMTITQKNLNIQPTLTVAPGYRFNIMVTADCVLEPLPK